MSCSKKIPTPRLPGRGSSGRVQVGCSSRPGWGGWPFPRGSLWSGSAPRVITQSPALFAFSRESLQPAASTRAFSAPSSSSSPFLIHLGGSPVARALQGKDARRSGAGQWLRGDRAAAHTPQRGNAPLHPPGPSKERRSSAVNSQKHWWEWCSGNWRHKTCSTQPGSVYGRRAF